LKTSYPDWRDAKSPLDHWKWKYTESPHGSHFVVVDWNGKIVGVGGRLFLNIWVDGIIMAGYGDDGVVHPDYRRKGIYKEMIGFVEEKGNRRNISLKFGIQVHKAAEKIQERRGSVHFPFPISYMLQIKDVDKHFRMRPTEKNRVARYGFSILKILNKIKNITKQKVIRSEIKVKEISEFDERINLFWGNIKNDYHFIIERNQKYLNWRYCDPRSSNKGKYFVKQAEYNGEILGFIVLEVRIKTDYNEGYISDLIVLPGRVDVVRKLLFEACSFFKESDINVVHYRVVKNHPYQTVFNEQGFIEVPSKMHLSYKMYKDKEKMQIIKNSKPSQIHFNYGDFY
jgi:GNAT superfamily N-acetyltransferase